VANRRRWIYRLVLTFFTLPNNYKSILHTQLWEMVQFGNGFTWRDVYTMPIHLRKFYFNKLIELKKKEKEEIDTAKQKSKVRIRK
jgi:hypothetical protein